jgi:LysR family transcriptional regulator, glycine cleavage system transcriptional activator
LLEDSSIGVCGLQTAERISRLPYPRVLEKAPILFLESEPNWGGRLSADELKNLEITRGATIEDQRILLDTVIHELGIGFVSSILANQAVKEGKVKVLTQIPTKSLPRLWLMRSRLAPRTPVTNEVFNWLLNKANCGD